MIPKPLLDWINADVTLFGDCTTGDTKFVLNDFVTKYKKLVKPIPDLADEFQGTKFNPFTMGAQHIKKLPIQEFYYINLDDFGLTEFTITNYITSVTKPTTIIFETNGGTINIDSDIT